MTEVVIAFKGGRARRQQAAKQPPTRRYPARIVRQLALAHSLRRRLGRGEFADFADMAPQLGFTRARVTQLMDLLHLLAREEVEQEEILLLKLLAQAAPGRAAGERARPARGGARYGRLAGAAAAVGGVEAGNQQRDLNRR